MYSAEDGPRAPLARAEFHNASYPSLETIVKEFVGKVDRPVDQACFDVAGRVLGGHAKITNLPWVIDETTLSQVLGLTAVHLLNDLEAIARVVAILKPDDLHTLNSGAPTPGGTMAVIAPGTGLGEAFLTWDCLVEWPSVSFHASSIAVRTSNRRKIGVLQGRPASGCAPGVFRVLQLFESAA